VKAPPLAKAKMSTRITDYTFSVTVSPGNDEWWNEVALLPTRKARLKEVAAALARSLEGDGFHDVKHGLKYRVTVKPLAHPPATL